MARVYVTGAGEALDLICYRVYGAEAGVVEQVLEANPHIKDVAHALPFGVEIALPDLNSEDKAGRLVKLWS